LQLVTVCVRKHPDAEEVFEEATEEPDAVLGHALRHGIEDGWRRAFGVVAGVFSMKGTTDDTSADLATPLPACRDM